MKELSIEEKSKAYDDAIKKAESLYKAAEPMSGCNVIIETLFPELAESKDERIRKVIYGWIYTKPSQFFDNGFSKEEMLAWIEKQDKQNLMNEKSLYKAGYLDGFEDGVRDTIIKEDEQKPAWSEEDEEYLNDIIRTLGNFVASGGSKAKEYTE